MFSVIIQKKARADLGGGKLKDLLMRITAKLGANAPSPYFAGDSITIADLQVMARVTFHVRLASQAPCGGSHWQVVSRSLSPRMYSDESDWAYAAVGLAASRETTRTLMS